MTTVKQPWAAILVAQDDFFGITLRTSGSPAAKVAKQLIYAVDFLSGNFSAKADALTANERKVSTAAGERPVFVGVSTTPLDFNVTLREK